MQIFDVNAGRKGSVRGNDNSIILLLSDFSNFFSVFGIHATMNKKDITIFNVVIIIY